MNKQLVFSVFFFASVTVSASQTIPLTYNLKYDTQKEVLVDGFSAENSSVEFDLVPQNSSAEVGVLLRYRDNENWVYVGCDKATDHLGFAYWYVETPKGKTEIARDISKLYAHYQRRIKVNCVGREVTLYVDGEQVAHAYIPNLPLQSGLTGFRVKEKGDVRIENVSYKPYVVSEKWIAKSKGYYALASERMEVRLNKDFPSVKEYRWKNSDATMAGQPFGVRSVVLNGDRYEPKVTSRFESGRVFYVLDVKEVGVKISLCCHVSDNVLQMAVTAIAESGAFKVKTMAFPDHYLVSATAKEEGACLSIANTVHSDHFYPLAQKAIDSTCQYGTILMLNNNKLVATLESNSLYNVRQFLYQTTLVSGESVTGIWGNEWIYRGHDGRVTGLPYIKVILSDDCNRDQKVDWQDGAVALRKIYPEPQGAGLVRGSYATITMNFASCAQYPFLRQLDNIKKFYLATDGFGQMLELKGYQSEGHDSGHPDYADRYNERAGGKEELAFLAREAKKYNAAIGVHINHSESYPEARAFDDKIITDMPAWSWLDQSYFINKEADLLAGSFEARLNQLKKDVPDLAFVYLDTYREYRWLAAKTAQLFHANGWTIWTEDSDVFDKEAVWIHYNPEAKSLIHRFVHHQHRDGYALHPALLGGYSRGAEIGFMGWQKGRDFYGVIRNFFTKQLPYRYLMHYPVVQLDSTRAVLEGGLEAFGSSLGTTTIRRNDQVLVSENGVFIPWDPIKEDKIYHYSVQGGNREWLLPESWSHLSKVYLYRLASKGRELVAALSVQNQKIKIDALADTGYVIYKEPAEEAPKIEWGEGGIVKDAGFDSGAFAYWNAEGAADAVSIETTDYGQDYLSLKGEQAAGVLQRIKGLTSGKEYVASVWVNVVGVKKATLQISTKGNVKKQVSVSESRVVNYTDNTDRFKTTWQRLKLPFRVPEGETEVLLALRGDVATLDTALVAFDDVRIVERTQTQKEGYCYFEDFENVDEGWGPFIPCQSSAFTTHLAERHNPYTDNTINGDWSLVTWRERDGEVYRTAPSMIRFAPQKEYEIEFDYNVNTMGVYKVVGKSFASKEQVFSYDLNRPGKCRVRFVTPQCDDFYIVILKQGNGMLVVDDFGIKEVLANGI